MKLLAEHQLTDYGYLTRSEEYKGYWVNDNECHAFTYNCLSGHIEASLEELKKEMIELRNAGLVELVPTVDSDYRPSGSGWFITEKGMIYAVDNNLTMEI